VAAVEESSPYADSGQSAPPSKGGFAVQFGAADSEADARELLKTVVSKYRSQLGGLKPTFKMATVNDKTVYRVRVGAVSKESANSICSKVKASGGSCFVAGN
jgi:cell division septation protein DedD